MAREKLMLYFNTDIEIEKLMWEYINKDGRNRKSYNIKKLLEQAINNEPISIVQKEIETEQATTDIKTSTDELDEDELEGIEDTLF